VAVVARQAGDRWQLTGQDGAEALLTQPAWAAQEAQGLDLAALAQLRPVFGVVMIRRAGYAVAIFHGDQPGERKVGRRHIHGRTAAGGWSQQRYARRRANQADEIVDACALAANRILGVGVGANEPRDGRVDRAADAAAGPTDRVAAAGLGAPAFLVTGGDRPLLASVRSLLDPPVAAIPVAVHLGVGTPDAATLAGVADRVLVCTIEV